jgi:UDP-N-acetylmuramoyl-tripeptide--D-alanyl-D-alanine ligase
VLLDGISREILDIPALPVPGRHNVHNFLAAVAVARYFAIDWDRIREGAAKLSLPEKRLQFVPKKGMLFLNDSYNASELSVKAALETLPAPKGSGRKIAVLGSMMELGAFSDGCHRRVGEHALGYVDRMFCLGEECLPIQEVWKEAGRPVSLFHDRGDLAAVLKEALEEGDVVLLKGSRSKELWKILDEI